MKNEVVKAQLNLRSFQSPAQFLCHYYALRKEQDPTFSYQTWAEELGYKNRSYLRFITLGLRPINDRVLQLLLEHFDFNEVNGEGPYFSTLVAYTQSKSQEQKKILGKRLIELSAKDADRLEVHEHYDFLSDQHLPILQTICGFEDVTVTPSALGPLMNLSEEELENKLNALEKIGLLENSTPKKRAWKAPPAYLSFGHREFYQSSLARAAQAMELPFDLRRFRSLFVALSEQEFDEFLKDFEVFVQEQLRKREYKELQGRRVYQLNFNFFPETNKKI